MVSRYDPDAEPTIWHIPDDLWAELQPLLPPEQPPGTPGRPVVPFRRVLDGILVPRPQPTPAHPQHLCRDRGCDYPETRQAAEARGYLVHTPHKRKPGAPPPPPAPPSHRHPARRWVIERTNSWHNAFRKR